MSYKKDSFEEQIDRLYEKSKPNLIGYILVHVPVIISVIIFMINPTNFMAGMTTLLMVLDIFIHIVMVLKVKISKAVAKEVRSTKMHIDEKYKAKIKILSFYNTKYEYKSSFAYFIKFYIFFAILLIIIFCIIFRNIDTKTFEFLSQSLSVLLFSIPFIVLYIIENRGKKVDINKLIQNRLKPTIINNKTIKPLLESTLYPYLLGKEEYIEEIEKGFSYSRKISDQITEVTKVYCNDYVYDLKDYKMYSYNVVNFCTYENSEGIPLIKEERTLLFEFNKDSIMYEIKILNTELKTNYTVDMPYKVVVGNEFLTNESKRILDEIFTNDVIDIYCNNGYVYIKKYIPRIIDKNDMDNYVKNIELYKEFVNALM